MTMQSVQARAREQASTTAEFDPAAHAADADSAAAQRGQARDVRVDGYLAAGREAGGLDGGMRGRAEASLGMGLGDVRVHQGEGASALNRELGSRAFAHGSDIVLGGDVANSANPVMAHELAHVAQQRGAAPGVAQFAERGPRGSAHEVDADRAAVSILHGVPTKVQQAGAEQVMCFEGAEHMELGNAAYGQQRVTVGRVTLPAGAFTAMQGDFFGTWEELERTCQTNPDLINEYYQILVREGRLRDAHLRDPANNPEPDSNGPIMLAGGGTRATAYLGLASTNFNHFSDQSDASRNMFAQVAAENPQYRAEIAAASARYGLNIAQWLEMHMAAGHRAFQDGVAGRDFAGAAVAMDAGALHYLTDAFAAGHMRTPRTEMYQEYKRVFQAKARTQLAHLIDGIPDSIDVTAFVRQGMAAHTPDWARGASDWAAGQLPAMTINLAGVKMAMRLVLPRYADQIGEAIASSVAGFSAKVLHDYDNEHGVHVFTDENRAGWTATGDHNLAGSDQNQQAAVAAGQASAAHLRQLHAAGRAAHGQPQAAMPFISLRSITGKLPQMTDATRNEHTEPGGARDWHWETMNPAYRAQIMRNAVGSLTGTVSSATEALKDKLRDAVQQRIHAALATLGRYAEVLNSYVDAIIDRILSYVPTIDPMVLVNAITAIQ